MIQKKDLPANEEDFKTDGSDPKNQYDSRKNRKFIDKAVEAYKNFGVIIQIFQAARRAMNIGIVFCPGF